MYLMLLKFFLIHTAGVWSITVECITEYHKQVIMHVHVGESLYHDIHNDTLYTAVYAHCACLSYYTGVLVHQIIHIF